MSYRIKSKKIVVLKKQLSLVITPLLYSFPSGVHVVCTILAEDLLEVPVKSICNLMAILFTPLLLTTFMISV